MQQVISFFEANRVRELVLRRHGVLKAITGINERVGSFREFKMDLSDVNTLIHIHMNNNLQKYHHNRLTDLSKSNRAEEGL